ncbi:MAG: hypothetical protein ACR2PK_01780 [Acidimicrobiales bacterium]
MNDDLEKRLRDWGRSVTPEPDPDFAQRVEADLRSAAYFSPAPEEPRARPRFTLRPALVLGMFVLLAGAAALVVANLNDDETETLAMEEAEGASVIGPSGAAAPAETGTELPDGTIIEVGSNGFAVVGGIVLPPDSVAVIVDGHVEFLGAFPTPATRTAPTPSPTAAPTSPAILVPEPNTETTPPPPPTVEREPQDPTVKPSTPRPTAPPTAEPTKSATPQVSPTATPEPTPTATATDDPTPAPVDVRIGLRSVNLGPKRAQLNWVVDGAEQVDRWRIRARRGDSIATVAVLRESDPRSIVVARPESGRVIYWIVALDAEGNRLASSNEVAVVRPRSAD